MTKIFLDDFQLKKGNYFNLDGEIKTTNGDIYQLDEWIGRGGNAAVYKCINSISGEEYAIKFLMNTNAVLNKRFLREARLLKDIQSDHIVKYYGTGRVRARANKTPATSRAISIPFIILELADKNLQELMVNQLHDIEYENYSGQFRGLGKALSDLHSIAIHRDIKPENILVSGDKWILSDYGLCSFVSEDEKDFSSRSKNIGPKYWLSPEAHCRRLGCGDTMDEGSDVFQLASIFWYVVTGRHPSGILTKEDWTGPEKLYSFIESCLLHDRAKRPQNGAVFFDGLERALNG